MSPFPKKLWALLLHSRQFSSAEKPPFLWVSGNCSDHPGLAILGNQDWELPW